MATTAASLASLGAILKQANEHPNLRSELNSSNKVPITSSRRCGLHRLMLVMYYLWRMWVTIYNVNVLIGELVVRLICTIPEVSGLNKA